MTKRKFRDLTAVFFCGLFVLTFEPVFLWLLVGALVLLQPESGGKKGSKGSSNILFEIGADARRYGMIMPRKLSTRSLLMRLYQSYHRSLKNYPHLRQEYTEVIEEMWLGLAATESTEEQEKIITSVLAGWPESSHGHFHSVQSKLQKVKELTNQWEEAKHEVQGGAGV